MSAAISMPGVKVDREKFLRKNLKPYCSAAYLKIAIEGQPVKVVAPHIIDDIAFSCINAHTFKATSLSFITGLGGLITIPLDIIQYYWHVFVLAQKLAYLYGFPDLRDTDGEITEESRDMLTLFVGIMMGTPIANEGLKYISVQIAKQMAKRIPEMAISKTIYYPIIKQVVKSIGVKLSKGAFARIVGKAVPILGGLVSGVLTAVTFKPGGNGLRRDLRKNIYLLGEDPGDVKEIEAKLDKGEL